jgi:aspartyl-tRNA(Asn)/glutamyl-tRNA(Gln) amidotransferase subunit A
LDGLLPFIPRRPGPVRNPGRPASSQSADGCYLEIGQVDPEVSEACAAAAARISCHPGLSVKRSLHHAFAEAYDTYVTLGTMAAWETHRPWFSANRDRYSPTTRERLEKALSIPPDRIRAARFARDRIMRAWDEYFQHYDYLVMPAVPCAALRDSELTPANRRRMLEVTAPASLGGLPVLTLPVNLPQSPGLTCGLQVIVKEAHDPILRVALRNWESVAKSS